MKKYKDFIKEEVDVRRNKGIPNDFISKSDQEARDTLGVRIDDESQMMRIWPEFERNMQISNRILTTDPNGQRLSQQHLNERIRRLEELAEIVVRDQFNDILNSGIKPIELDIRLVPMGRVSDEVEDITDVPTQAEQPNNDDQKEQDKKDTEKKEKDKESKEDNKDVEDMGEAPGTELVSAIDKKKLLNMITQAAGKSTKDIIKSSDIVDDGLKDIFGDDWRRILDSWIAMSDLADKMDWVIPINRKAQMMSGQPQGMAGACEVKWESYNGKYYNMEVLLEKEASKIVIHAAGVDFPMLIHETIKGIYLFLQSGAIKQDKETAKLIKKATSSFSDEAQDFRYGPPAQKMLLFFVNKFPESDKYKRLDTKVFTMLSVDKERAIEEAKSAPEEFKPYLIKKAKFAKTDNEFLEIMKSLFSVFDLIRGEFVINEKRFNESLAKEEIKKIIDYIVQDIEDYKRELKEWEDEERRRAEYNKYKTPYPVKKEEISDKDESDPYLKMSQSQLRDLIDDALDERDYEKVKILSKYIKEGKEIYLREIERLYEYKTSRKNKK
jgi:uncharacterized protein involved in tolerance to divalent cations